MCLIIAHKRGAPSVSEDELRKAWTRNDDGAGLMWLENNQLWTYKPFFKLKDLVDAYQSTHDRVREISPLVLHMRLATHGKKDKDNTHPHSVANGLVGVMHNGILLDYSRHSDASDTAQFCNSVLAMRDEHQIMGKRFALFLEQLIGANNKLVLLSSHHGLRIINANAGTWEGDTWFSNTHHRTSMSSGVWCRDPRTGQWTSPNKLAFDDSFGADEDAAAADAWAKRVLDDTALWTKHQEQKSKSNLRSFTERVLADGRIERTVHHNGVSTTYVVTNNIGPPGKHLTQALRLLPPAPQRR